MSPPSRRPSTVQKVKVGVSEEETIKLYIHEEQDSEGFLLGLRVDVVGNDTLTSMMNCLCRSVSKGLQSGIDLSWYVEQFTFVRFEPAGQVQLHPRLKNCTSLVDLVFRHLAIQYLGRDDLAHVPAQLSDTDR